MAFITGNKSREEVSSSSLVENWRSNFISNLRVLWYGSPSTAPDTPGTLARPRQAAALAGTVLTNRSRRPIDVFGEIVMTTL
jgi:hypothetical protein